MKDQLRSYTPYGFQNIRMEAVGNLGFNGEFFSAALGCYMLGNGRRIFNPRLMRFISPDILSPFDSGGMNCYAYCLNDPVNAQDPSGKTSFKAVARAIQAAVRIKNTRPTKFETLKNIEISNLQNEMSDTLNLLANNRATVINVTDAESVSGLPTGDWRHKFIYTRDGTFVVGSFQSSDDMSHASIAELLRLEAPTSAEVISAGYLNKQNDGTVSLNNHSGHYRPPPRNLAPAIGKLRSLNITITGARHYR